MRIAVVCSDLGVRIPGTKGASIHLDAITRAFAELGHQVLLVGVAGHGSPPPGIETFLLPHPGRTTGLRREIRKLVFTRRLRRAARAAVDAFGPDVVYERLSLFGTAGRRLAADTGARHVLEINALLSEEETAYRSLRLQRIARRREDTVLRSAALRVAVSDELASRVRERCGLRVDVVPNGVERQLFENLASKRDAREAFGLPPDGRLVGFTGSLRPWHGLDLAIDALGHLPGVDLVVAGEGDVRAELEARAERLHVSDRVHWLGHVPHDRIAAFLASLDVAVAPYPRLEKFSFSPLKLYEYLAAGVPVVASDIGQIPGVIDEFGVLVPPGDAVALAGAIDDVLARPDEARRAAAAGREWVLARHGWTQRAEEIVQLIDTEARRAVAR